ncbi:MAG: oligosaccharide flippase family protein [Acholeplasma sp.]|nr:oligosaccharide flippase family protein [Acholeplasma sp.]
MGLNKKNKLILLLENFFAYGLISVLDKIIPFLMLPIITRILPDTSAFGSYDLFNTIVGLGVAIAGLGIFDAMFREFFERTEIEHQKSVTSTSLLITGISSIILGLLFSIFAKQLSMLFFNDPSFSLVIYLSVIAIVISVYASIVRAPTRMQNKRTIYIVSGIIQSIILYGVSIFLIFRGWSFYGLIIGFISSYLFLLIFYFFQNKKYFSFRFINKSTGKELLKIGIPLVATSVIYWVFHSLDRVMIANIIGLPEVGVYSAGAKVASISNIVRLAFAGGWGYFLYSSMKDKNHHETIKLVLSIVSLLTSVLLVSALLFKNTLITLLLSSEYSSANSVFIYLFMSPLFLIAFQIISDQFIVIKKSYLITISLFIGALLNILLNLLLIPIRGIEGAAFATFFSYVVAILISIIIARKFKIEIISVSFTLNMILISIYLGLIYILHNEFFILLMLMFSISIFMINYKLIVTSIKYVIKKIKFRKE